MNFGAAMRHRKRVEMLGSGGVADGRFATLEQLQLEAEVIDKGDGLDAGIVISIQRFGQTINGWLANFGLVTLQSLKCTADYNRGVVTRKIILGK